MMRKLFSLLIVAITLIGLTNSASAEQLPISVTPVFPDNQNSEIKSYFSLHANESHFKQLIEFIVTNRSKEEVTIEMEPLNALNSPQKGIQYTSNIEDHNTRLLDERYALANYIRLNETITLASGETKIIQADIEIPDLDGTILGAIGFKALNKDEEDNDNQLMIHNEVSRTIGVQINKKTDETAELVVDEPFIDPMSAYYVIRLPIELNTSILMTDVLLEYEVFDDEGNLLFESEEEAAFNIAPNTLTEYALAWQHDTLEENKDYKIKGKLTFEDQTLEFNKTFDFNEVRDENQGENGAISKPKIIKGFPWDGWVTLMILVALLGGGIIVYLMNRKKKDVEEIKKIQ